MAFSFSSFSLAFFSICRILKVSDAFTSAITKYINNRSESSPAETVKVNRGGIKKKSQISALNMAEISTGAISKNIAIKETVTSKIRATTL